MTLTKTLYTWELFKMKVLVFNTFSTQVLSCCIDWHASSKTSKSVFSATLYVLTSRAFKTYLCSINLYLPIVIAQDQKFLIRQKIWDPNGKKRSRIFRLQKKSNRTIGKKSVAGKNGAKQRDNNFSRLKSK